MGIRVQELDWQQTPIGEISLRRRVEPVTGTDVYEVLLGEEYLMSSMFTVAEEELARLGLASVDGESLDVVVGGLGLGYTARAALTDPRVASLTVVEALGEVIGWHERGLLPLAGDLTGDLRCLLLHGDFFRLVADGPWPGRPLRVHAVLLDIDHSPRQVLHPSHADFYSADGLRRLLDRLHPRGVFALWSDERPDDAFLALLRDVFAAAEAHVVSFANPLTGGTSANTVYAAIAP